MLFLFSDRYFGRKLSLTVGLIAAFNWVFIYYEDELLLDSLLVLFSILVIWTLFRSIEKPSRWRIILAGLTLGVASITRPNYLAFLPAVFIWMIFVFDKKYKTALWRFAIYAIACGIIILPVYLRNLIIGHDNVLIASQGGINFYIGNNQYADGASAVMPEFGNTWQYSDCEYLAKKETGRLGQPMKPSAVSSFYYEKAYDFIKSKPADWIRLSIKKISLFWNSYEISNNQNLYFFRQFASITKILPPLFFIIAPFSLIGLILIFRYNIKYHLMGHFIIIYMLTVVVFFVNGRFRLPVWPFLIILAALAFYKSFEIIKTRSIRKIVKSAIILIILFALTNIDFYGVSHENFAMSHFSLGNVYLKKGLNDKALDEYDKALALSECTPSAHLNRGIIFFEQKDFENARKEFDLEIAKCHVSAAAHNNLAVLDRLQGDDEGSLKEARQAINISPQFLDAYVNIILASSRLKDNDTAYKIADSLTTLFPDYLPGHYFKGKMLEDRGQLPEAENEFLQIVSKNPQDIVERYDLSTIYSSQVKYGYKPDRVTGLANYELGLIQVKKGKADTALNYFKKTTELLPELPDAWTNLALAYDYVKMYKEALAAFKKSIELDPENALTYYNCALTLAKVGLLDQAIQFFKEALDIKPDFPEAREKLNLAESLLKSSGKQ